MLVYQRVREVPLKCALQHPWKTSFDQVWEHPKKEAAQGLTKSYKQIVVEKGAEQSIGTRAALASVKLVRPMVQGR